MQSYSLENEIIDTRTGSRKQLEMAKKMIPGAVHHIIADLPKIGQKVDINGLIFRVSSVSKRGKVNLRLM